MTMQSYHTSRVKSKSFVFISRRHSIYGGRCSGADRRLRTRPRDMGICADYSNGARIKDMARILRMHRNSIRYILNRDLHNFLKRWEHFRKKIAGLKKAMHNELSHPPTHYSTDGLTRWDIYDDMPIEMSIARELSVQMIQKWRDVKQRLGLERIEEQDNPQRGVSCIDCGWEFPRRMQDAVIAEALCPMCGRTYKTPAADVVRVWEASRKGYIDDLMGGS